jgi:Tol biopolymer transport system component
MKTYYQLLSCLLFTLLLAGCENQPLPNPLPNAEIVYQIWNIDTESQLGFVNSNGYGSVLLPVNRYAIHPKWSIDGKMVFGMTRDYQSVLSGTPTYWDANGNYKKCEENREWFNVVQIEPFDKEYETKVLMTDGTIFLADLESCEKLKVLVDYPNQGGVNVEGFSYFPEKKLLVYSLRRSGVLVDEYDKIIKIDIVTNSETILGLGFNPSWSPDGSQIAYVQSDGIYIMNANGLNSHRIFPYSFLDRNGDIDILSPFPNWSPDGKWLVYHRCNKPTISGCGFSDYDIYKVDIASGVEQKIIEHGIFPDWRKVMP